MTDGGRITDDKVKLSENVSGARKWARIVEVTHTTPARKVFELIVGDESKADLPGWAIYRSRHLPSLPSLGDTDSGR